SVLAARRGNPAGRAHGPLRHGGAAHRTLPVLPLRGAAAVAVRPEPRPGLPAQPGSRPGIRAGAAGLRAAPAYLADRVCAARTHRHVRQPARPGGQRPAQRVGGPVAGPAAWFHFCLSKNQNLEDRPLTTRKLLPYLAGNLMAASCTSFAAPTEIQFWHSGLGALDEALDAQVQAFNESQPDYKVVRSARGSYEETLNNVIASYRAKKHPHLFVAIGASTQTMLSSGAIEPVQDLMAGSGYDI